MDGRLLDVSILIIIKNFIIFNAVIPVDFGLMEIELYRRTSAKTKVAVMFSDI